MANQPDMGNKMREYLRNLPPLTVLGLKTLYQDLAVVPSDEPQIRYQLYRHAAGTPVFGDRPPRKVFAIKLENVERPDGTTWDGFLSLPGIDRDLLLEDNDSTVVARLIAELKDQYGKAAIDYWVKAAQRRSVDLIRGAMEKAKARTGGKCALCSSLSQSEDDIPKRRISACHIISRKTVVWKTVCQVSATVNIFTDDGVNLIIRGLRENDLHSNAQFIIGLCNEHDQLVRRSLRTAVIGPESPDTGDA